jgi:vacuolar-type H+-ATPase subunit F/Vma7
LSRVLAVLAEGLGAGFSLAGVEVEVVAERDSAREAILAAAGNRECGILIIDEELFSCLGERERESLLQRTVPLLVLLPGELRWGEVEEITSDEYVAALIRRAVGYQLNIRM